jgi:hypothetical protein
MVLTPCRSVTPIFSREPLPAKFKPELLSERGMKLQEKYWDFWRAQELREKIREKSSVISNRSSVIKLTSNLKAGGRSSNLKAVVPISKRTVSCWPSCSKTLCSGGRLVQNYPV